MAAPNTYSSGAGGASGAELATISPLIMSGTIVYLDSVTGDDAYTGLERVKPVATLAQAVTNSSNNGIIDVFAGHQETLTAVQTIGLTGLSIVGEGTGGNRPKFTRNVDDEMFDVTGAGLLLDNLYFVASGTSSTAGRVRIASVACEVTNCYFECGANDDGPSVEFITGAGQARIEDTTFISTATLVTAQPDSAIKVTNAMSDLVLKNVTLNGGSTGWAQPYAINGAAAVTRLRATKVHMLGDSDATFATGNAGYFHPQTTSGSARIAWAA